MCLVRRLLGRGDPHRAAISTLIADGNAVKWPGELTRADVEALVDDVVTVTDEELARAVVTLLERAKPVAEPAGGAAVAALLAGRVEGASPFVATVSGGNVGPLFLQHLVAGAGIGRYASLRTPVADRPGGLPAFLALVAEQRANIVGVSHHRLDPRLQLGYSSAASRWHSSSRPVAIHMSRS